MKGVSTILLFVSSLSMLLITVFLINQLKMERTFEEKSMFECGFNGKMSMTHSFSINYFYITIIFLMFDLEVLIIAPLALFYSNIWESMLVVALTTYFTLILAMEWMNSMLQWQKWH